MADVFLSYKSEDRSSAELIARSLEAEGLTVWWDPELQSGEDYQDTIDTNLRSALVVVVLWSPLSVKSRWVRSEATVGDRQGALLPVMVRACDRPLAFELVQTADLTRWQGDRSAPEWRQVMSDLRAKLSARQARAASEHPPVPMASADLEALFWSSIKDSTNASDFESYLRRYPTGHFLELARRRLEVCKAQPQRRSSWIKRSAIAGAGVVVVVLAILLSSGPFKPTGTGTEGASSKAPTSQAVPASTPAAESDKVIDVWFAGSPHRAGEPSGALSQRIRDTARTLGYSVRSRAFEATAFMPELVKALAVGSPPDVIFIDNYMHFEGGETSLGSFAGMQSDPGLRSRLWKVDEALSDLGRGWAFLVTGSPDHDGAQALVFELSSCPTPMPTPVEELRRSLQLQAEAAVRGFVQCSLDASNYDRSALSTDCSKPLPPPKRVAVCRISAAPKLAFVETAVAFATERGGGRRSVVSVHRLHDDGWRVLAVSSDPVSVGQTAEGWRELAPRASVSGTVPGPAILQTPDGLLPSPPAGERFGAFSWAPAKSASIGQVVEMNYGYDTRFFLLGPAESQLSTGMLWSTGGTWRWRIWTLGSDGTIATSDTRSFQQKR